MNCPTILYIYTLYVPIYSMIFPQKKNYSHLFTFFIIIPKIPLKNPMIYTINHYPIFKIPNIPINHYPLVI